MTTLEHISHLMRSASGRMVKLRFVLAGVLNTCFGLTAFPTLFFLLAPLDLHYLFILVISHILSVTFSFLTSKYFVFRSSGSTKDEYLRFILFHAGHLVLNLAALPLLVALTAISAVWCQTIFAIAVVISSYFWHSRITFSSKKACL